MPKTSVPAAREAVALLQDALAAGHAVTISLAVPPRVDRTPAQVATCCLAFRLTEAEARILVALAEHGYGAKEDCRRHGSPRPIKNQIPGCGRVPAAQKTEIPRHRGRDSPGAGVQTHRGCPRQGPCAARSGFGGRMSTA